MWRWRRFFFLAALGGLVIVTGAGALASQVKLPDAPPIEAQTTFICPAGIPQGGCNKETAMAELHDVEDRVVVRLDQIPLVMVDAVVAAEDHDFFNHGGVDPVGISRAALSDIKGNSASRQGGSTITQQYVKNVFLTNQRTFSRKIREAVLSVKLEQQMSKEQILENYLNTIYFGRGAYGVQAAAQAYFDKNIGEVTLPEAALLAGLIRAPERAEPFRHQTEAKRRRTSVLKAMLRFEKINQTQFDEASNAGLDKASGIVEAKPNSSVEIHPIAHAVQADYFIWYVLGQLLQSYGRDAVYGGGLRVYTTLDLGLQGKALNAVTSTLNEPNDPAGSIVSVDDSGSIRAMVGGIDHTNNQLNLAVGSEGGGGGRQPGSTFKAFALAEALKEGFALNSRIPAPSSKIFKKANNGGDWKVSGGCCGGIATLETAIEHSSNTAFAQLMLDLGPDKVIDMAHRLGVEAEIDALPSAVLGTEEVSVLDMASAYSTFASKGTHIQPRVMLRVERADGSLVEDFPMKRSQVLDPDVAAKVTYALEGVVTSGTGKQAKLADRPTAGKTGTTQQNWDAWFVGFVPKLTTAVWMGYPNANIEMKSVHGQTVAGGNLPAIMWKKFMTSAMEGEPVEEFPDPGNLKAGRQLNPALKASNSPSTRSNVTKGSTSTSGPKDSGSNGAGDSETDETGETGGNGTGETNGGGSGGSGGTTTTSPGG